MICSGDMGFSAEKTYDIEVAPSKIDIENIFLFIMLTQQQE